MTQPPATILLIDDDAAIREVLRLRLQSFGYRVETAEDAEEAQDLLRRSAPDVVVTDVVLPGLSGIDLLRTLKAGDPDRPVVLVTSHGSVDLAVEAMKAGAEDFLTKPIDEGRLRATLGEVLARLSGRRAARRLAAELAAGEGRYGELVGRSPAMRQVFELIEQIAAADVAVLITGASGTGKELVARMLHHKSRRSAGPFVAVNAAAIPAELMESEIFGHEKGAFTGAAGARPGCFEQAHRGTLLLDEIAEMPAALQPKLLRVLEDGRVRRVGGSREMELDVRVVAATNREPRRAVAEGRLREDLFYRLSVFTLHLPPLAERREDLPLLVQHLLGRLSAKHGVALEGVDPEAMALLDDYAWPGNVRELRNVLERALLLARDGWIRPSHLPPDLRSGVRRPPEPGPAAGPPGAQTLAEAERALILQTLAATDHNKAEAARRLGITAKTIYNKLKAWGED